MFIDGYARKENGGIWVMLRSPEQIEVLQAIKFGYSISNNEV